MKFGRLLEPRSSNNEIDITKIDQDIAKKLLSSMILIREVEKKLAEMKKEGKIGGPVHLSVGQEAVAVGLSHFLKSTDHIFGAHRSHAHLLALNPDCRKLFAEVLGRATGFSRGMGGSMHLWDKQSGFSGSVPIVAGTVPLAVGAGLASKFKKNNSISVSYLGDGAMEEGVVHESLNLASYFKIPVIFVVENNLFASHMHISQRQPINFVSRFAESNNIKFELIDGNDIGEVMRAAEIAVNHTRTGQGPFFIEAITYRWFGHVDWREDIDVGLTRSKEEVSAWRSLDPIKRLEKMMITNGFWNVNETEKILSSIKLDIDHSWQTAYNDPEPSISLLHNAVYNLNSYGE